MTTRLLSITLVALSAVAVSAMAQDTGKSKVVQEDPILTAVQSKDRKTDEALALPSDPENSTDDKVQEDPLLKPAATAAVGSDEHSRTDEQGPAAEQDSAPVPRVKVQEDPILDSPPPAAAQKPAPREEKAAQEPARAESEAAEREADKETRLVPKPKDKAVQEDPLLRTGTPF